MAREADKKGVGWFKAVLSNQNQTDSQFIEESADELSPDEIFIQEHETEQPEPDSDKDIFSKDNLDKTALDLIYSVENMIKDRELLSYKNKGLNDQLSSANETIQRLKQEIVNKDQVLQDKNEEIHELENKLSNKQMSYDQLIEDYKEFQLASKMEYEKISNQLETQTAKYNKLSQDFTEAQHQNMLKVNLLEERIRNLEIENQKYIQQYQEIVDEKQKLMETINEFTSRMSFSFSKNSSASNQQHQTKGE